MKICMLTTSFPRYEEDSHQAFVYELAKNLVKRNIKVKVITSSDSQTLPYEIMNGVKVHRYIYMLPRKYQKLTYKGGMPAALRRSLLAKLELPLFIFSFFLKSLRICRNYDLIHAQLLPCGLIGLILKKIFKKPVILTVRGSDIMLIPKKGLVVRVALYILNNVDKVISISEILKEKTSELGISENKIRVIPNGINIEKYTPREKNKVRQKLNLFLHSRIILFVGRITYYKGLEYIFECLPDIIKKEKDVVFVFIGDGNLKNYFIERVKFLNIQNNVIFAGLRPKNEIPLWMSAADISLIASIFEGGCNTLLEAMSSQLAVITTSVGWARELIEDGRNGFLIPEKNSKQIGEKLSILLKDINLRKEMGRLARKTIIDKGLTWSKCASNYIEEYRILTEE